MYNIQQGSPVSFLAQTGFAAFDKGVQLVNGPTCAKTEQLSLLISPCGVLPAARHQGT